MRVPSSSVGGGFLGRTYRRRCRQYDAIELSPNSFLFCTLPLHVLREAVRETYDLVPPFDKVPAIGWAEKTLESFTWTMMFYT